MQKRIWLDTDPGIGVPFRDLDDGLAILMLLASPEVILEGISINFGNVGADRGYEAAREVLDVAEADIPLYKGAVSRRDLGRNNPAVEALIDKVARNPAEISLLAIAPLTNVATAMILDTDFQVNLREFVVMGGTRNFWPFSSFGEFNFHLDARAAQMVVSAPVRKTLINMDVCSQVVFRREHLEKIKRHDSRVARYLAKNIPTWLHFNRLLFRKGGFFPWDPVAAAYMIDESLFDSVPCTFDVVTEGYRRGRMVNFRKHQDFEKRKGVVPLNMPENIEKRRFMDMLLDRLLSFP